MTGQVMFEEERVVNVSDAKHEVEHISR
jgi:hypothetical protein